MARRLALAALALAGAASAADVPQWPPPPAAAERMRDLQAAISKRDSTPEQREAARRELARLLMSPAAGNSPSALGERRLDKQRAPRAAIDPFPSVPPPPAPPPVPAPGVAQLEVVTPSRPLVNSRTGATAQPIGRFAIDPRTGAVLHETPTGFIDPRTGK